MIELLVADISEPSVAVKVSVLALLIAQENVATPADACWGFDGLQLKWELFVPLIVRVTAELSFVAVLPAASSTVTTVVNDVFLPIELGGPVVKTSFAAGPLTVKAVLVAAVSEPSVAVKV